MKGTFSFRFLLLPKPMNQRFPVGASTAFVISCSLLLGSGGCKKSKDDATAAVKRSAVVAPELGSNDLMRFPGAIYRDQASSPIHWQPWTMETLERAKAANRLVFAVVAMPQKPGFHSVLSALASDPLLVSEINDIYVPVLVDGDAAREVGLLTADLCSEIQRGLQLPLFLWLTPDANPVAWIPVNVSSTNNVLNLFNQSHSMVSRMWREDSAYVERNSALDNGNRRTRIAQRKNSKVMSEQPGEDAVLGVRQLTSLYDPMSRSFDEAGGLFPAGALDLMSAAAIQPGFPEDTRARCRDTTRELMADLLSSAMFDPLDGGVFTARRGSSWALPSFSRDCASQARVAVALLNAYRATGNERARQKALGLISFAENSYRTTEGLFAVGMADGFELGSWLWRIEDIERLLPPEEAGWWIEATAMKGLGNLPSEVDPRREYFRCNSLGISRSLAELAAEHSLSVDAFTPRFEGARKILLKERNARIGPAVRDDCSHAGSTFRMVSAYAAAFAVTGDVEFKTKAIELLKKAQVAFSEGPRLREFSRPAPASIGEARAFVYGLALQAALDVSVITSEEKWLLWSEDLATTAAELFTDSDFLKECPDDAKIIDLPITDLVMLFDDSTAGLISFAECRLAERERPLVRTFSLLATPLPTYAAERPILHTDLLEATIAREFKVTVIMGENIPADLKLAVECLPLRMIQRRSAKPEDEVPAGSVMVVCGSQKPQVVSSAAALRQAVLPSDD